MEKDRYFYLRTLSVWHLDLLLLTVLSGDLLAVLLRNLLTVLFRSLLGHLLTALLGLLGTFGGTWSTIAPIRGLGGLTFGHIGGGALLLIGCLIGCGALLLIRRRALLLI